MNLPSRQRTFAAWNCPPRTSNPKRNLRSRLCTPNKTLVACAVNFYNTLESSNMCPEPLRHARIINDTGNSIAARKPPRTQILRGIHDTFLIRTKRPQCAGNLQSVHEITTALRITNQFVSNKNPARHPSKRKIVQKPHAN